MSSNSSPEDTSAPLGLPQLAVFLLLGYLLFRWYNSSAPKPPTPGTTGTSNTTTPPPLARTPRPQDLARLNQRAEVVHGMFPQIPLSAIKYELQRNGGSVETTTEKILANGYLPEPPTPPQPSTTTTTTTQRRTPQPTTTQPAQTQHPDLITRYNLTSRLASEPAAASSTSSSSSSPGPGAPSSSPTPWSQNKAERAALHQKRRDEMILNARRRCAELEAKRAEKERAEGGGIAGSSSAVSTAL
ncbi:hypothetical protein DFH27DRAFT_577705 [Peziza echinospora]|nr:hypothetical protein DFH27DRAFT_577705 [Peziza echinospora]